MGKHSITISPMTTLDTRKKLEATLREDFCSVTWSGFNHDGTSVIRYEDHEPKPTFAELVKAWRNHITTATTFALWDHIAEHGSIKPPNSSKSMDGGSVRYMAATASDGNRRIIVYMI